MHSITVHIPATTANLGPGFDSLGMALDVWNLLWLEESETPGVTVAGHGEDHLSSGADNLVYRSAARYFQEAGKPPPTLAIACQNRIPLARGLGSSAAAIVGGLVGASALAGDPLDKERLLPLAIELEGHPDNVTPALFGGCQIVVAEGEGVVHASVPVPEGLTAVLFIPDEPLATSKARGVLADPVGRADAVYNMGRVALLVNALGTGDLGLLRTATQDRLHQPARERLFPAMRLLIRAALDAGALGAFLSGAGPTVLALTRGKELTVAYEMADMAEKAGVSGEVQVTRPVLEGAQVSAPE